MFHREQLAKEPYRSESNAMDHKAGAGHIFSTPEQNCSLSPYSVFLWLFFLLLWEERITLYTHSRELFPAEITVFNTHRTWENVYNFMGKCLGGPMFWPIQEGWKLTSPPVRLGSRGGRGAREDDVLGRSSLPLWWQTSWCSHSSAAAHWVNSCHSQTQLPPPHHSCAAPWLLLRFPRWGCSERRESRNGSH